MSIATIIVCDGDPCLGAFGGFGSYSLKSKLRPVDLREALAKRGWSREAHTGRDWCPVCTKRREVARVSREQAKRLDAMLKAQRARERAAR